MYKLNEQKMFFDIADNQAIVINTTTGVYYAMNELASFVLEKLLKKNSVDDLAAGLKKCEHCPKDIEARLAEFIQRLTAFEIILPDKEELRENISVPPEVLNDKFLFSLDEFTDAQDIMIADPVHDVDADKGWPVMKNDPS